MLLSIEVPPMIVYVNVFEKKTLFDLFNEGNSIKKNIKINLE